MSQTSSRYEFEAVFQVTPGRKLGFVFQTSAEPATGVTVISLKDGGQISEWNSVRPAPQQIISGVNVVSWNGQTGTARHLSAAIKQSEGEIRLRCLTGPRHHPGVRQALQRVFDGFDFDRSNALSLDEFGVAATKVALEVGQELDEDGVEVADADGSGMLDFEEFFDYNIGIFEKAGYRVEALANVLNRLANRTKALRPWRRPFFSDPTVEDLCAEAYELLTPTGRLGDQGASDGGSDDEV